MAIRPTIQFLSPSERKIIIEQMYELLETLGVAVHSEEAQEIFREAGCTVEGERVKIPRKIVEDAIASAPSSVTIYDREGDVAMELGERNVYFGPGPTCIQYFDAKTGERRAPLKSDAATTALVSDALPHIDFVMALTMISDKPSILADIHEFDAMVRNTTKPLIGWAVNIENLQVIIDMAAAVAGGADKLKEKPFFMAYAGSVTPLIHTKEALEEVMMMAQNSIPCVYTPGMMLGATAPVTMAGALSVGLCECISGLVLGQLVNPGAPFIVGPTGGPMDMKSMQFSYGAPEFALTNCCAGELCQELGLPSYGGAGTSDAKVVDAQAAAEAAAQVTVSMFSGNNLVHDVGFMDLGMTGSPLYLTLCDDIIGYVRRLHRGVIVEEEYLAKQEIIDAGPGGNFLTTDLTLDYYAEEIWQPKLFDRFPYDTWAERGSKTMTEVAQERLNSILENHVPQALSDEVIATLDAHIAEAEKREAAKAQ